MEPAELENMFGGQQEVGDIDIIAIGRRVKQIEPYYADFEDEQVGLRYVQKYGSNAAAMKAIGVSAPTAAERQAGLSTQKNKNVLDTLFKAYYPEEVGPQGLALGQTGVGGRIPAMFQQARAGIAPTEFTEFMTSFQRQMEASRPGLAKAAGDAGNIAWVEQIVAGKGVGDTANTPGEAFAIWAHAYGRMGHEVPQELIDKMKQYIQENPDATPIIKSTIKRLQNEDANFALRNQELRETGQDKQIIENFNQTSDLKIDLGSYEKNVDIQPVGVAEDLEKQFSEFMPETEERVTPGGTQGKDLRERGFLEQLFSLEGTKGMVTEAPGLAVEGLKEQGKVFQDLLKGDVEGAKRRAEEFRPKAERSQELFEATQDEIAAKASVATGLSMLKNALAPKLKAMFGTKPPAITEKFLTKALEQAGRGHEIRDKAIKTAQEAGKKVDGNKIYSGIKSWAKSAKSGATDAEVKQINQLLKRAEKFYKGKMLNPTTAKERWDVARQGYTAAGKAGNTVKSGFHTAVRDGVRQQLDKVAPGFEKGTKMIKEGLNQEKILKGIRDSQLRGQIKEGLQPTVASATQALKKVGGSMVSGAARTAGVGIGLGALAKIFGVDIPGAIREQQ
jgi:hypothetical protein